MKQKILIKFFVGMIKMYNIYAITVLNTFNFSILYLKKVFYNNNVNK